MATVSRGNIYSKIPKVTSQEAFRSLAANKKLRIERIVSYGQSTKKDAWLTSLHDEWVIVLQGAGMLRFQKNNRLVVLKRGDYIFIPAKISHRVEWTLPRKKTIWLAVHSK